jgi:TolB-like protein/Tfp pilus assembly protein PilF
MHGMHGERWLRLKDAFAALSDATVEHRVERLDSLAVTDPDMHAALEALLRADALPDAPAPHDTVHDGHGAAAADAADADPFNLTGQLVSHFRVLDVLGRGGMGVVYRAQDMRLGRTVALKFLLPQYASSEAARQRFLTEARAASALEHPNVCTVYEAGETDAGHLFLAMACYDGVTLRDYLAANAPLPVAQCAELALQVLRGLAAAHRAGIVHRDLKPGNLLLTADGVVHILDFGLAGARDERSPAASGLPPGTIPYMSPEQIEAGNVDYPSDLWSLGVVLYEMLTGRTPFRAGRDLSTIHSILSDAPPAPSTARPDAAMGFDAIVLRLLAREPSDRYASADDVMADIAAATQQVAPARSWRMPAAAAAAVLVLAAAAGGGLDVDRAGREPRDAAASAATVARNSVAVLPFEEAGGAVDDGFYGEGIAEEILNALHQLPELHVTARASAFSLAGSGLGGVEIGRRLGVANLLGGTVRRNASDVRVTAWLLDTRTDRELWSRTFEGELHEIAAIQTEIARAVIAAMEVRLASDHGVTLSRGTGSHAAHNAYLHGLYHVHRRTPSDLRQAIHFFEEAVGEDSTYARAHAGLALAWSVLPLLAGVPILDAVQRVEAAAHRALDLDPSLADPHAALGYVYHQQRRWNDATDSFERALELDPKHATALQWYGEHAAKLGYRDEAERMVRNAVSLDPLSVIAHLNLGLVLWLGGGVTEAVEQFEHTLRLDPGFTIAHLLLFRARLVAGDAEGAVHSAREWAVLSGEAAADDMETLVRATSAGKPDARALALLARWERSPQRLVEVVLCAARMGEIDLAMSALERAFDAGNPLASTLAVAPWVEPLRGEPRLQRLIERLDLPASLHR